MSTKHDEQLERDVQAYCNEREPDYMPCFYCGEEYETGELRKDVEGEMICRGCLVEFMGMPSSELIAWILKGDCA